MRENHLVEMTMPTMVSQVMSTNKAEELTGQIGAIKLIKQT